MTERELLDLCDPKNTDSGKAPWVYWTTELYGHGKYIREYAFYSEYLPLIAEGDHAGIMGTDIPYKYELESDAPVFFSFSKVKAQNYSKLTGKKSYVIISPAVYYRRKYNINQLPGASGTVAFAAHSIPGIYNEGDVEKYAHQLKVLPEKYQPVTVCLHMHDVKNKQYKIFQKCGLPVVTAGNTSDRRFIERFYEIIRRFSYTTSNMIGSYSSLSVEMDIPFFIYGEPPILVNRSEINIPLGEYNVYDSLPVYKCMYEKFQYRCFNGCIDQEFKTKIENWLGVQDSISRKKMFLILWSKFFKWIIKPKSIILLIKYNFDKVLKKNKI